MKISVIIPVYNQPILLRRAVESIPLEEDLEVIIVDDASTDNTWEVAQKLSKEYSKVSCYRLPENQGPGGARNLGIEKSQGEYLLMLDSDDYIIRTRFKQILKYLNGDYDIIYFNLVMNSYKVLKLTEKTKNKYVGMVKFLKRDFIGDTRYPIKVMSGEDGVFQRTLQEKNPKEKFTNIILVHYNHPRKGSLDYNASLARKRRKKLEKK